MVAAAIGGDVPRIRGRGSQRRFRAYTRPPANPLSRECPMSEARPPLVATLDWRGDLRFAGTVGSHAVAMDGSAGEAPTPVHLLALSLAGCMAIDLVHILGRGRHTVASLNATFTG